MEELQEAGIAPEQVEQPAEATAAEQPDEQEAEESTQEVDTGEDAPAEPQKPKGVQKRIDELTRQKYEAQREADHWRQMAMRQQPLQQQQQTAEEPEPTREQFNYDDEAYLKALASYQARQIVKQEREEAFKKAQAQRQQQAQQEIGQKAQEVYRKGLQKHTDFDIAVDRAVNAGLITQHMAGVILESDVAPDLAYYLASNAEVSARIAQLGPYAQAREIAKLEVKLATPKVPAPSKAPPPVKPVGVGTAATSELSDDLPLEEWIKRRNKQTN